EAEGLGPVDGEEERRGLAEEARLVALADLSHELHVGPGEERLHDRLEIRLVELLDLRRDAQPHPRAARDADRAVGSLLRRDAPEESEVAAAPVARREEVARKAV